MKNFLFPFFSFFMLFYANLATAQTTPAVFEVITDDTWTSRILPVSENGGIYYVNPVSGATLTGGTWGATKIVNNYTQGCQIIGNYTNPGNIITEINAPTLSPCDYGNTTTFFQKNFTLPLAFYDMCDVYMDIRADDAFRLYINGFNIPAAAYPAYSGGGCPGNSTAIIGGSFKKVYHVLIPFDYLIPGANNQIIIEVQNCGSSSTDPSYVTAKLKALRYLQPSEANFKFLVAPSPFYPGRSQVNFSPATSTATEFGQGIINVNWTIEYSDSPNGPFQPLINANTVNSDLRTLLDDCRYYRVTRTVTNGCSTVSFSKIIYFCDAQEPEKNTGNIKWIKSDDNVYVTEEKGQELPDNIYAYPAMEEEEVIEDRTTTNEDNVSVAPNPASDELYLSSPLPNTSALIYDVMGKKLLEIPLYQETTVVYTSQFTVESGLFIVQLIDNETGKILEAKKLVVRR